MGYNSDGSTFAGTGGITEKALLTRNLILGAEYLMSHITHYYHLSALNYVQGPPMGFWKPYFDNSYYGTVVDAVHSLPSGRGVTRPYSQSITGVVGEINNTATVGIPSGTLEYVGTAGEASGTIWGGVILDYVEALHMRRRALEMGSLFAGALPMFRNYCAGGITYNASSDDIANFRKFLYAGGLTKGGPGSSTARAGVSYTESTGAISKSAATGGTADVDNPAEGTLLHFIYGHLVPITEIVSLLFPSYDNSSNTWLTSGGSPIGASTGTDIGAGYKNFLAWGVFNSVSGATSDADFSSGIGNDGKRLSARGYVTGGGTSPQTVDQTMVYEFTTWSKYTAASGPSGTGLNPANGVTDPDWNAKETRTPYSWLKSPRIKVGSTYHAMEVGPLARMWVNGTSASSKCSGYRSGDTKPLTALNHHRLGDAVGYLNRDLTAVYNVSVNAAVIASGYACGASVMDRHRARAMEALKIGRAMKTWLDQLQTVLSQSPVDTSKSLPASKSGYGLNEAPRGALAHFVTTDSLKRIDNYQCVVPTTWNANPSSTATRSDKFGPIEKAIMSPAVTLSNVSSNGELVPVEALRIINSFDPCIACAVHVVEAKDAKAKKKVRSKKVSTDSKKEVSA